ncbi:hypothetical protein F4821DRAFT_258946 [Hypoxylon rubiginosum]|uniref:Uncharacterized protein n=1 Tax=Hypoxylon rubiginosum TaxID=110542 RepID=A0ACC0D505_9PEZI|nr:hypothetical protein F4821DRAFT_258946 [Hypoxylon rubiginosum]
MSSTLDNYEKILERCDQFQRDLNTKTKIIVVVGQDNKEAYTKLIPSSYENDMWRVVVLKDELNGFQLYSENPRIHLLQEMRYKTIKKIVVFIPHSMHFLMGFRKQAAAFTDMIINGVCQLSGVEILDHARYLRYHSPIS